MFDVWHLLLYVPTAALVAATPGPNNLLCLTHGMQVGLLPTAISLLGRCAAFAVMVVLVALGLGTILETSEVAFTVVKWAGVAYLAYVGLRLCLSGETRETEAVPCLSAVDMMRREFLVAITNPKAMLIFTAFLPQFVVGHGNYAAQLMVLGAIYLAMEFLTACLYAVGGAGLRKFSLTGSDAVRVNRISGGMMLGAAALLATVRRG